MLRACLSICLILLSSSAAAEDLFLKSKEVTVTGLADIAALGSEAAARDAAIKNAQRNAIESVIGVAIESAFSAEQREAIKGDQVRFQSTVDDKVYSKSSGFIESQRILEEKKEGGTYRVKLVAVVKTASLKEELAKLKDILISAERPKLMLILTERYTNQAGKQQWVDRPSIVPVIEEALLARGFDLVAKDEADKLREEGLEVMAEIVGTPEKAAEIASRYGAEVAITGTCEVTFSAFNEMGQNMYYLSAIVNLRATNASTAKILASFEATGNGVGVNEELARVAAVKKAGPVVISKLIDGLLQSWKREAEGGRRFVVVVLKVADYAKVARPLMKEMKKLDGVEALKELNYGGKRLELEVIFNGTKEDLLDGIFDQLGDKKPFRKLNKVMDRGNNIELTL